MKTRLLIKLRERGRNAINIYSVTKSYDTITGMTIGYDYNEYSGIFQYGMTEQEVRDRACKIWFKLNINYIRKRYEKYTRKYKLNNDGKE